MSLMLLDKVGDYEVKSQPWPHVVARIPLTDDECLRLIEEVPPLEDFSKTKFTDKAFENGRALSNKRLQHLMPDVMEMDGLWPEFVKANSGPDFAHKVMDLFGGHYNELDYDRKVGEIDNLRYCQWRVQDDCDIGWTVCIGANTPSYGSSTSVLPNPHLDAAAKIFFGLYYLRHPNDKSEGGDLLIYDGDEVVSKVEYERNVFVLGLNSPGSIHSVTPRGPSGGHPRLFANVYAEVHKPLFKKPPGY